LISTAITDHDSTSAISAKRQAYFAALRENIAYYFDDSMHFLSTTRETTIPFDGA